MEAWPHRVHTQNRGNLGRQSAHGQRRRPCSEEGLFNTHRRGRHLRSQPHSTLPLPLSLISHHSFNDSIDTRQLCLELRRPSCQRREVVRDAYKERHQVLGRRWYQRGRYGKGSGCSLEQVSSPSTPSFNLDSYLLDLARNVQDGIWSAKKCGVANLFLRFFSPLRIGLGGTRRGRGGQALSTGGTIPP